MGVNLPAKSKSPINANVEDQSAAGENLAKLGLLGTAMRARAPVASGSGAGRMR
jgi:hypothetical protein